MYRSYGIHALLNAVCDREGVGAAVLIRALEPLEGIDHMRVRRGVDDLCSGPGKLTQALGVTLEHNKTDLAAGPVVIEAPPPGWESVDVVKSKRIGITKAAERPWRYGEADSRFLSRPIRPRQRP